MTTSANEYLSLIRPKFPSKTEAELELLFSGSRELRQFTGMSGHEHRRRAMEKLFPSRVWHDWREERMQSVQDCLESRTQELMWIGSADSGKSGDMADIALSLWWTKPELTTIYITSPYDDATEKGLWSLIIEQFNEAKDNNPGLPGRVLRSKSSIVQFERNPRSFITKITADEVGKLVGKKSRSRSEGLLVIIADELNQFKDHGARNFIKVMANLRAVSNLLVIGGGNFGWRGDALGVFSDPDEAEIPGGYDQFDPDKHFRWKTKRGGLCLRFDGLKSPNVKAGRDIYPFLTTLRFIAMHAAFPGGLESPDAMQMVRSAPCNSLDAFTVTNGERIRAGGCFDQFEWTSDEVKRGAFMDPAFGGGDDCVIQKFKLGWAMIQGKKRQILALWDGPFVVPIRIKADIPIDDQIALAGKAHCEQFSIPAINVGYDGSMRASVAQKIAILWSMMVLPIDSGGPATDRRVSATEMSADGTPIPWKAKVDRLISELWFATASLIDSGQLRNLTLSPKAASQLCDRRWERKRSKRSIETKAEYKDRMRAQGKPATSPNEGDALVGCVEMARRMGLTLDGVVVGGGSLELVLTMIREREMKHLLQAATRQTSLPSGALHAMRRETVLPSGTLNRRFPSGALHRR